MILNNKNKNKNQKKKKKKRRLPDSDDEEDEINDNLKIKEEKKQTEEEQQKKKQKKKKKSKKKKKKQKKKLKPITGEPRKIQSNRPGPLQYKQQENIRESVSVSLPPIENDTNTNTNTNTNRNQNQMPFGDNNFYHNYNPYQYQQPQQIQYPQFIQSYPQQYHQQFYHHLQSNNIHPGNIVHAINRHNQKQKYYRQPIINSPVNPNNDLSRKTCNYCKKVLNSRNNKHNHMKTDCSMVKQMIEKQMHKKNKSYDELMDSGYQFYINISSYTMRCTTKQRASNEIIGIVLIY